ncbi:MAG TPA: phosphoenolpyruvate synthase [Gammaproteobacteria bacterium]|nr:phosphoenolpyruvate synthase [Gammaproteobacteria bacterium]
MPNYVVDLADCGMQDVACVGGKNASLGEMIHGLAEAGVTVPRGFATTAAAFSDFLAQDGLDDAIRHELSALDVEDVESLTRGGARIRDAIRRTPLQPALKDAVEAAWRGLASGDEISVAVRSSATAEDLPEASFAGQQETFLNVVGVDQVIERIHEVFASLYNDRAIAYRVHHGFDHSQVGLSAGVQLMARSDIGSSGVMFTLDTESGFEGVVLVTSSWGLGESVVQGAVNPDEFYVYKEGVQSGRFAILRKNLGSKTTKMVYSDDAGERVRTVDVPEADRNRFSLNDDEVHELARQALTIERHYGRPMDIEWAKDGRDGKLWILQARPETVQSRRGGGTTRFSLKARGPVLASGRSIGQRIGAGRARIIASASAKHLVESGDVLVTDMTDPDWEPVMKRAAAIVTDRGGRTCHAAIIARELGIPAVVGCGDATSAIRDGTPVTVSCAEGDEGFVYEGLLAFEKKEETVGVLPELPVKLMLNVGNPDRAFTFAAIPNHGVGLARLEFIVNRLIGVHPRALLERDRQDEETGRQIDLMIAGYGDPVTFYIDRLAEGIACIAAAFAPSKVIVRLSDFKSNEYANLVGGSRYEPTEENPMIGFRGASRYLDPEFRECFELECRAVRKVRETMGLANVEIMVPFVRTVDEARAVIDLLAEFGLRRGQAALRIIMMCEVPSNALLADEFLEHFDGMSIGSNDMTQLALGLDRDSGKIASLFDERNPAVLKLLAMAITACRKRSKYIGICGQGPSDHPDFARWLIDQGIETISLNPDSMIDTWIYLAGELGVKT